MIIDAKVILKVYGETMINVLNIAQEFVSEHGVDPDVGEKYIDEKFDEADKAFWDALIEKMISDAMSKIEKDSVQAAFDELMGDK